MVVNEDGSVDIFFGPTAPDGLDSNWIPTGEDFFLLFRLFGPAEGWLESGWPLSDLEKQSSRDPAQKLEIRAMRMDAAHGDA